MQGNQPGPELPAMQPLQLPAVPLSAAAKSMLGKTSALMDSGRFDEALCVLRQAEEALCDADPLGWTATIKGGLARCLDGKGRTSEALSLFREAVDSCLWTLGEDHPFTTDSIFNLARWEADQLRLGPG